MSDALLGVRLLTLTGAGGCGKTTLALRVAERIADRFPDGVWSVELAPVSDPALVGPALARALGIRAPAGQSELEAATAFLAARRALVVLDNCEHLLETAAEVAEALLRESEHLRVLATSREPLRIPGETTWCVPSLSLTEDGDPSHELPDSDAVRLFVERAAEARPGFALSEANAGAVVRVCRELDGIPLAIELAAARVRLLTVDQIAAGLDDRFRLLTGGARNALVRQQTLRASVDWSYELLTDRETTLLARLAVFMGGFTLEAAETVCAGDGIAAGDVLGLLASLVEKSLVQAEERGPEMRYRLLETVRQYALDRLAERREVEDRRDLHRDAYRNLAQRLNPRRVGWERALGGLDAEDANLAHAVEWALRTDPRAALELCSALSFWWQERGAFAAGEASSRRALEATGGAAAGDKLNAKVASDLASLLLFAGRLEESRAVAEHALAAAEAVGSRRLEARSLATMAGVESLWRPLAARELLERCCAIARELGDDHLLVGAGQPLISTYGWQADLPGAASLLAELWPLAERAKERGRFGHHAFLEGHFHYFQGDLDTARRLIARAVEVGGAREPNWEALSAGWLCRIDIDTGGGSEALDQLLAVRDRAVERGALMTLPWVEACVPYLLAALGRLEEARSRAEVLHVDLEGRALHPLGLAEADRAEVLRLLGEDEPASSAAHDALDVAGQLGNPWLEARARVTLGRLAAGRADWSAAERDHHAALQLLAEHGHALELPSGFEALAEVAAGLDAWDESARLLGAARRAADEIGLVAWAPRRAERDRLAGRVRAQLSEAVFEARMAEGAALSREEAVAWVRRARGERKRPAIGWESLTPTEVTVAGYIAEGLSNPQIADRMFVSRATVKTHLAHIYAKLELDNRVELARIAGERLEPR